MLANDIAAGPIRETHEVTNQPTPLENYNVYEADTVLKEAVRREGGEWGEERARAAGEDAGRAEVIEWGHLANKNPPALHTHDRFGQRIDEVKFHPSYHELMALFMRHEVHCLPWKEDRPGAHVVRSAVGYTLGQVENGVGCPMAMTFSAVPSLRHQPEIAKEWIPRLMGTEYDPRLIDPAEKTACTMGMAMTEKQGGSDVRANTTRAIAVGIGGPGQEYELIGHKWFCSAPMSDAFLTLAYAGEQMSCFLVPRILPDGTRNRFYIQRLKDKLGNKSNASSEIEYNGTRAWMIGEPGRGVPTIIEMVNHTRLECVLGVAGIMRQAVVQALHHTAHRSAFKKLLADQPLMRNVLADLCIESEAATTLGFRLARAYDEMRRDDGAKAFGRLATAVSKYWTCKRTPGMVYECMECHGGNGYVEDSIMPRLYREAPLNSIWEGSGNVISLDVLRAMAREPESVEAFFGELATVRGDDKRLDAYVASIKTEMHDPEQAEMRARRLVGRMALALQATLLLRHAPSEVSDAFITTRIAETDGAMVYGTLPKGTAVDKIIERHRVQVD